MKYLQGCDQKGQEVGQESDFGVIVFDFCAILDCSEIHVHSNIGGPHDWTIHAPVSEDSTDNANITIPFLKGHKNGACKENVSNSLMKDESG